MTTLSNTCLAQTCISGSSSSPLKCLDQTFDTKTFKFDNNNRPCISIPFSNYYSTLIAEVQSNWVTANFYLIKSGIGSNAKMGFLGINHAAVLLELQENTNPIQYKYHIVGEVEVGDSNIVVNGTTAKGAIFPTFTSTTVQEPIWAGKAVILAGPICYTINKNEMNMDPVERASAVLSLCGLTKGSGNPIPLLYLTTNTNDIRTKLKNFINMIKTMNVNNNYIFLGFKSFQSNTKCITGHPYTCETFASIMASYLYREFRDQIQNNSTLHNYYNSFLLKPSKHHSSCNKNLPDDAILTTMYEGRYKNSQLFLHVEQASFLDVDAFSVQPFNGKTWKQMTDKEQLDCFNFWYFITNNSDDLITQIKAIYNAKTKVEKLLLIGKLIKYIKNNVKGSFNNLWITAYQSQGNVFSDPVFFSSPLKTYNMLEKKYVYSPEKIVNIFLMTESSIQKESDFDPIINMKLINTIFPQPFNWTFVVIFICIFVSLLLLLILLQHKSKLSNNLM